MKCIYCNKDTKYRDRRHGTGCISCGRKFAFEPYFDTFKITDPRFKRAIQNVSGADTVFVTRGAGPVFFTERQLWYELNRRLRRRDRGIFFGLSKLFRLSPETLAFPTGVLLIAVIYSSGWKYTVRSKNSYSPRTANRGTGNRKQNLT